MQIVTPAQSARKFVKCLALCLPLLLVSPGAGAGASDQFDSYVKSADKFYAEGKNKECIAMLKAAIADADKRGQNDIKLAKVLEQLSGLYRLSNSEYREAEELLKKALQIRERELWAEHPDVVADRRNLADLAFKTKEFSLAEQLIKQVIATREKKSGKDAPELADDLLLLAMIERSMGKTDDCIAVYKRALAAQKRNTESRSETIVKTQLALAHAYCQQARWSEAEPLLKDSLATTVRNHGQHNQAVYEIKRWLVELYMQENNVSAADQIYKQAPDQFDKIAPSTQWAGALSRLGQFYIGKKQYRQAETVYKKSVAAQEKLAEKDTTRRGQTLVGLGDVYCYERKFEDANKSYEQAIHDLERDPANRNDLMTALDRYVRSLQAAGLKAKAGAVADRLNKLKQH